ncbi:MAG: Phospho-N-acetylmuramoyl-pentapeptide-transferase [Chlamydiae bacterium]|nr:Phospho-N-acetylmuramoyl-pentapeptide-transferase [Chlamydiota bacterium]
MNSTAMVEIILKSLHQTFGIKVPMVFYYTSTRMMLAAITALVISIFFGPWFIKKLYELKIGQSIRTDECPLLGELHAKKKDTPTMGGVLIVFSILISMFLWMELSHVFTLILFATTAFLGFLGGIDDYLKLKYKNAKGLSGKKKLLCQVLLSSLIALYLLSPMVSEYVQRGNWFHPPIVKEEIYSEEQPAGVQAPITLKEYASRIYVPFVKEPVVQFTGIFTIFAFLFIVFVITGSSNAVNLTDGLDGLAVGCLLIVAICLAIFGFLSNNIDIARYLNILYIEGSGEIAVYLSAFVGGCLGFLWYNGYPAQIFMGDTGSLSLGGVIGVSAVLLKRELLLAIVGGIFVVEALSVIVQVASFKFRNKKRVFLCAPLHHHFEYKGWPETKVVIRFWIIAFLLAIVGMASLKFQ